MRELAVELKQLRMHGMAGAWADKAGWCRPGFKSA